MPVPHHRHSGGDSGPQLNPAEALAFPADFSLREVYVDINQATSLETGSRENPYKTIQAAVDAIAALGDNSDTVAYVIHVAPGTYTETLTLEDDALYSLAFLSTGGPAVEGYAAGGGGVIMDPASGDALESEVDNNNLHYLYFKGFRFLGTIHLIGEIHNTLFGEKALTFEDCGLEGSASITLTIANLEKFTWINGCIGRATVIDAQNIWVMSFNGERYSDWPMGMAGMTTLTADTGQNMPYHMDDDNGGGDQMTFKVNHAFCQRNKWTMVTGGDGVLMVQCINGLFSCGSGITMPDNGNLYGYTGIFVGDVEMNAGGALFLYNTAITGTLTENGCAKTVYPNERELITHDELVPTVLRYAEVPISSADVLALYTTAKELVAAPGAGYLLEFISLVLMLDWDGGTIYTKGSASELQVRYHDKAGTGASHYGSVSTFIIAAADIFLHIHAPSEPENYQCNVYPEANKSLVLALDGGNPTLGTSPLKAFITYRVLATG